MKTNLLKKIRRKFVIWYDPNDEFYRLRVKVSSSITYDDVYRSKEKDVVMIMYRKLVKEQLEKYREPEPRKPIVYIKHNEK